MKRLFSTIILAASAIVASAQTSLVGRVYHHPNIMADEIKAKAGDLTKNKDEAKAKAIAKAEKKKGRALTAEEKTKVEKQAEQACKAAENIIKGITTMVTATFKTDKEMEMQMKMQVDEEALKEAGVSWAKRKLLKTAVSIAPSKETLNYIVQGNLIICSDGTEKDTLTISPDGKYLYGKMDEKTSFTLTRTK